MLERAGLIHAISYSKRDQNPTYALTPEGLEYYEQLQGRNRAGVITGRAIGQLSRPFAGGSGPGHTAIERIWMTEDALEYLPTDMSKADRVLHGLKALRDGVPAGPGQSELPADPAKLDAVAGALVDALKEHGIPSDKLPDMQGEAAAPRPTNEDAQSPPTPKSPRGGSESEADAAVDPDGPIFVVHGHDQALRHEAVRVLERSTGRDVVVLHEQPNAGRTLLEKFEEHAAGAAYAVVLLTGDDVGGVSGAEKKPRGRQNVIFELGFFFGKLGRQRVAVLLSPGVEQPSDISGLVYIPVDDGAWKLKLARELEAADIKVDYARIP